jgi:hypothetical protein
MCKIVSGQYSKWGDVSEWFRIKVRLHSWTSD